jgi:hypothetical protein
MPAIVYVMYIVVGISSMYLPKDQNSFLMVGLFFGMLVIGFILTFCTYRYYTRRKLKDAIWIDPADLRTDNPIIILGAIYGIVAGLAITKALEDYHPNDFSMTLLLIGFFTIALTFYHGAAVFLTTTAAELYKKKYAGKLLYNFIFLFTEAIFLFFISESLRVIDRFVIMFLALLVVDLVWSLTHQIDKTINKNGADVNPQSYVEWIHLDFLMIGFLIAFLAFHPSAQASGYILLAVLLLRSVVDYRVGWQLVYFRRLNGEGESIF